MAATVARLEKAVMSGDQVARRPRSNRWSGWMRAAADLDLDLEPAEASQRPLRLIAAERAADIPAAIDAVAQMLLALGFDLDDEGLQETPRRVAMALAEMTTPKPFQMTSFANTERYSELVLARGIPFHSLCQHHLLPFIGVAHIGYLPADRIVGLSKLARTVEHFSRGLQVQERLTTQIADCLEEGLRPNGVGVVLEAEHLCMSLRGVQKPATTVTSALLGAIRHDARARQEFLALSGVRPVSE